MNPKLWATPALMLLLSGCATGPQPEPYDVLSHRDPVEETRETANPPYRSVLAGYHPRTVAEPKPWLKPATPSQTTKGDGE